MSRDEKVEKLAAELRRHKQLYYSGHPEISDEAFDRLEQELKKLAPGHPVLSLVGSPDPSPDRPKMAHLVPMLSLDKTYDDADVGKWAKGEDILGLLKIDGSSLHLQFDRGQLKYALTRGDGRFGEDVSDRVQWVSNLPLQLPFKESFGVRGELFCPQSLFLS